MGDVASRLARDGRPVAAVFRSTAFALSEVFIQVQAASLRRYQPLIVALRARGELPAELVGRLLTPWGPWSVAAMRVAGRAPLPRGLAACSPKLVHAHFATDGLTALPIAEALGVPLVTSLRGYDVTVRPRRMALSGRLSWMRYALLSRRLMRGGQLFLAVSDALRRAALDAGFPADRTLTHYDGVDLSRFPEALCEPTPGLIIKVGRLVEKKGDAVLLRAFAQVRRRHPAAQLAIIGEGPLEQRLRRLAADLELGGSVAFLGAQPHAVVRERMRKAWVVAAPSLTASNGDAEGLPTVVVEAAAAGTPVVGTRHSGIPEAVVEGENGFLVPEGDVEALAVSLTDVLASPQRARMGARARALAEARFDGRRQGERLEAHYDRLVAGRGA